MRIKFKYLTAIALIFLEMNAQSEIIPAPVLDGEWWSISDTPDLGEYNTTRQRTVDFGVWKAADDTWQLWSCITGSNYPGSSFTTRFFYGWEGKSLTSHNWEPKGIKWAANPSVGETPGGMQAPYVFNEDNSYYLFYGDWRRICFAKGMDGKNFKRVMGSNGQPDLFSGYSFGGNEFFSQARDAMVIKKGNTYYCYYTNHVKGNSPKGGAFVRTSTNLIDWSEEVMVAQTPSKSNRFISSDECPHVVYLPEQKMYYLFVTQQYGKDAQTTVYASPNPLYFGVDDDSRVVCTLPVAAPEIILENGQYYLAALKPGLDGMRISRLKWE